MLRRLVRSYYRLRYFPRLIAERLISLSQSMADLKRDEAERYTGLSRAMADLHRDEADRFRAVLDAVAGLHRYEAEVIARLISAHEERLATMHEEITGFCDDAIRAMLAISARIGEADTRIAALQNGFQRLDNGIVDVQSRLAALQHALHQDQDGARSDVTDRAERVETLAVERPRFGAAPPTDSTNDPDQAAVDEGRLSHA